MANSHLITKHVLLVDDEPSPRREVRRALEVVRDSEFQFEVDDAESVAEYHDRLRTKHYDVLVLDLRLSSGEEGTDDVLAFHHIHSPDTIVVVYSAFPNLDKVHSVVRAMRTGAVDCIEKSRDRAPKAVVDAVLEELRRRTSTASFPSTEWLERVLPDLTRDYGGKAIAIQGENVVESADSVSELRRRLAGHQGPPPYLMVVPKWGSDA